MYMSGFNVQLPIFFEVLSVLAASNCCFYLPDPLFPLSWLLPQTVFRRGLGCSFGVCRSSLWCWSEFANNLCSPELYAVVIVRDCRCSSEGSSSLLNLSFRRFSIYGVPLAFSHLYGCDGDEGAAVRENVRTSFIFHLHHQSNPSWPFASKGYHG